MGNRQEVLNSLIYKHTTALVSMKSNYSKHQETLLRIVPIVPPRFPVLLITGQQLQRRPEPRCSVMMYSVRSFSLCNQQ